VADLVALYSGNSSARNVLRETSKATAIWVGDSEAIKFTIMEANP